MSFKTLIVLESEWEGSSTRSYSVWPMILEFTKVYEIESFYKFFVDGGSLSHWVRTFSEAKMAKPALLYVAAHGFRKRLVGTSRSIEFGFLRDTFAGFRNISFVYLACCHIGSDENLSDILRANPKLKWAAGYSTSVNWVDSLAFDLLFLSRIAGRQYERKGIHVQKLVSELLQECPGLSHQLGFRFQFRQGTRIRSLHSTTEGSHDV